MRLRNARSDPPKRDAVLPQAVRELMWIIVSPVPINSSCHCPSPESPDLAQAFQSVGQPNRDSGLGFLRV